MSAQPELVRQNERLQLLLQLTNKITSNLGPRDVLDEAVSAQQNATPTQPDQTAEEKDNSQLVESIWLPPRDSNPDMLIQSYGPDLRASAALSII